MNYEYCVYILSNWNDKVLYVGVTNDLQRRTYEHKNHLVKGFTSRYNLNKLVYYECGPYVHDAITREHEIKGWIRAKKNALISAFNPQWEDLSADLGLDNFDHPVD
jgi:putative endonuclease